MRIKNPVVIYGLINPNGTFFYVGATQNWASRLGGHRKKFGFIGEMRCLRIVDSDIAARIESQIISNRKRVGQCPANCNINRQSNHRKIKPFCK